MTNTNFYFETSAVNYLVDRFNRNDAIATKALQAMKGNLYYLSPISIWEILLTKDPVQKEKIIYYCQHLFHEKLMNSPSEFIINYINSGCPQIEKRYDFHSKSDVGEVWLDLCRDPHKTFNFDTEALTNRTKQLHKVSKQLDKIINRIVLDITVDDEELAIQQLVNFYHSKIINQLPNKELATIVITKISILFMLYTVCLEVDIYSKPYRGFWKKVGINDNLERLDYLLTYHTTLLFRGPIYQMAVMAFHQLSYRKQNRGLFLDCLHSIYITYTDIFVTYDNHFDTLMERVMDPNHLKIHHISSMRFTTKTVKLEIE